MSRILFEYLCTREKEEGRGGGGGREGGGKTRRRRRRREEKLEKEDDTGTSAVNNDSLMQEMTKSTLQDVNRSSELRLDARMSRKWILVVNIF